MKESEIFPIPETCIIRQSKIFKNLNKSELEKVSIEKTCEPYKKGTIIYKENSHVNGIFCIYKGIIKIYKTGIDGKEQIIRFAKPGDLIAFRSVLSGELACTTAKVLEDSILCYIPSETLFYLIKNNGNFALELLQLTCKELDEANSYIKDIAQKTVRERLAEILLHLKENFELDNEHFLKITLSREELANIVGTATETVIRLLSEFKNDNFIELYGRKIKILNIQALEKLANQYD
ncbi:MAG: Crp/Fnr family transcriptional regulator [Bacteroidota bacterium]|nr:Crp/Fnr family transcriptional regulator [Bacteroidota bacterium]